eukprot:5015051-Prymnesium_polylepis.1
MRQRYGSAAHVNGASKQDAGAFRSWRSAASKKPVRCKILKLTWERRYRSAGSQWPMADVVARGGIGRYARPT